MQHSRFP